VVLTQDQAAAQLGRVPVPDRPPWVLARRREIGHRIARYRAARGWSLDDLAGASGVSRMSVIRAETGSRSTGIDVLLQLAHALDVSLGTLLDEDPAAGTGGASGGA
jgi:ribosome-binding protein aMBF1 (putative translation factor)